MNNFQFPKPEPKASTPSVCVSSMDDEIYIVQAVILFNDITRYGLMNTKRSFEASFPDKKKISVREFGEWVRAFYAEKV